MLERLGPEGMSSEEEGVEKMGNINISVFWVKICAWHAPKISEYFKCIDREADNPAIHGYKGSRMLPRIHMEELGILPTPAGLPLTYSSLPGDAQLVVGRCQRLSSILFRGVFNLRS
jgi:hypothetical protein